MMKIWHKLTNGDKQLLQSSGRKLVRPAALLAAGWLLAAGLAGCGGSGATAQPAASPGTAASPAAGDELSVKAQELFTANKCISCHGVDLAGRVGPTTNLQKIGATKTKEQIAEQIKNGGGGMPAYKTKLSEDEVALLADWLSTKK